MTASETVRVRFAPSPTGRLHIGGARTALFNWAFARRMGGTFILRVEDTDRERNSEESLQSILSSLRWLGLDWDEGPEVGGQYGPYFQSERMQRYREAADRLLAAGRAYRCFCAPERIEQLKETQRQAKQNPRYDGLCRGLSREESDRRAESEAFTLRFAVPENDEVLIPDLIRGEVRFASKDVEDWVMVRTSGMPTYNFCCVVDDAAMEISHVLRGEEHLTNTPKQVLLYRALGLSEPLYAHVPLILGKDGKKLSKRTGDTALEDYRSKGFPPEALFNFLSLLGFSIDDKTDVFSPEQLVEAFDFKRINKSGAIFDTDKLAWLCGEYIRNTPLPLLTERVQPWLQEAGLLPAELDDERQAWLQQLVAAMQERIRLYADLPEQAAYFFTDEVQPDNKARKALEAEEAAGLLQSLAEALEAETSFPPAEFDAWIKAKAGEWEVGLGKIMKPTRAALSGTLGGPAVGEILTLLGRERALKRLRSATTANA